MARYQEIEQGIHLVKSETEFKWKCNGILVEGADQGGAVLIDCNLEREEHEELRKKVGGRIDAYFVSHVHLDHVNFLRNVVALDTRIFCPVPEHRYLRDLNVFMEENGAVDFGIDREMKYYVSEVLQFNAQISVDPFNSGESFVFGDVTIETIHVPGHSPGHTAFLINRGSSKNTRTVLFVSDIGIEPLGAWYGFKYCDLDAMRNSVSKLEAIYLGEDSILASSHAPVFFEKRPEVFQQILTKIDRNERRLLEMFNTEIPRGLEDVTLKSVFYNTRSMERMSKMERKLYFFWEGSLLLNHIAELVANGTLIETDDNKWLLSTSARD
ncbi:MAG: MBL fold metallo-hydrolase [Deltaproteobacteria bacterium]|nr:MBL fold metallo-hydrolase [Deltaproteobacteria bacterium]